MPRTYSVTVGAQPGAGPTRSVLWTADMENCAVNNPVDLTEFKNNIMGDPTSVAGNPTVAYLSLDDLNDGDHEKVLAWNAPADTISPTYGIGAWAKIASIPVGKVLDEVWLSFDGRFDTGFFDPDTGGKFMGVGGKNNSISSPPSGGAPTPNGCSSRFEFLSDTRGGGLATDDELVGYTYDSVQTETFGIVRPCISPGPRQRWGPAGTWKHVEMYCKMNTILVEGVSGNPDGLLEISVDGILRLSLAMTWRIKSDVHWTHAAWSMFYGGDSTWGIHSATKAYLDNLMIEGILI